MSRLSFIELYRCGGQILNAADDSIVDDLPEEILRHVSEEGIEVVLEYDPNERHEAPDRLYPGGTFFQPEPLVAWVETTAGHFELLRDEARDWFWELQVDDIVTELHG